MAFRRLLPLLALLAACSADYEDVAWRSSPLIAPFESYLSPKEARGLLPAAAWEETQRFQAGGEDGVPRYDILVYETPHFEGFEHFGRLELSFFNDRLMETRFHPATAEAFLVTLERQGLQLGGRDNTAIGPHTALWAIRNGADDITFRWADRRLMDEADHWREKYHEY